jgi:hypothetical protein
MSSVQYSQPVLAPPRGELATLPDDAARISFRQPVSTTGYIDAAWWPRSLDLAAELPGLLDVMWTAGREINRVTYSIAGWDPAPRQIRVEGRTVRLGGFADSDPLTIRLTDAWRSDRIDILVIAPDTDPALAQRALLFASEANNPDRAAEILARAGRSISDRASA